MKRNTKGHLTVQTGSLSFEAGAARAEVTIASVVDIFTGEESQRRLGGTVGTVSAIAAPYETGRILSLFRKKVDVITLEYQDANGGSHGAIITLPRGEAAEIEKQLIAQGARHSTPVEAEMKQKTNRGSKP